MRLKIIFSLLTFCLCSTMIRGQAAWNLTSTMTATLTDKGVLTIKTTKNLEAMPNYNSSNIPWRNLCSGIFSVIIENGISSIGNNAFRDCGNLTSVTIPNSVTTIGNDAFYNCTILPSVAIPNSVKTIGESAFNGCSSLTSITIPNSVTIIGASAFENCINLTTVMIPSSVTTLSSAAFANCKGLKDITVQWNMPLVVPTGIFREVNTSNVMLHVPAGTEFFYQTAAVWMFFAITSNPVNMENIDLHRLKANTTNGILHISGLCPGEHLSIYTLAGQIVYKGIAKAEEEYIPCAEHGVCIVVTGERSVKVFTN